MPPSLLFLHNRPGQGGSNLCLLETLAALQRHAPRVELAVVSGSPGPFADGCRALGIEPLLLPMPHWRKWTDRLVFGVAVRRLARALNARRVDWVIANEHWWAPLAVKLAGRLGCRGATFIRDGSAAAPGRAAKLLFHRLHRILPSSTRITTALQQDPELREKVVTLYDATQLPGRAGHRRDELKEMLAARRGVRRWLAVVGSVDARKDQLQAVETLAHLGAAGLDTGLILAGTVDEAYGARLRHRVAELGLTGRVVLLGHWDDLYSLLEAVEAVLLTSRSEGLPRSITEAILARRLAFMFEVEGSSDIFGPHAGRFVTSRDPAELAARLMQAWRSPAEFSAALAEVANRLETQFSPENHVRALLAALA